MATKQFLRREALTAETTGATGVPLIVVPPPKMWEFDGSLNFPGHIFKNRVPFIHNDGGRLHGNTAVGLDALVNSTPGSPAANDGALNSAFGQEALRNNITGSANTATGYAVLSSNTTGSFNTAAGYGALSSNTTGALNTASGAYALFFNRQGTGNTAFGNAALFYNNGNGNVAIGRTTLTYNQGDSNTAVGLSALANNTYGTLNTAVGHWAGFGWTNGDYNVALGAGAYGVVGESGTIRIGGSGRQTRTFVEGIRGATGATAFDEVICTNSQEQLGPCSPSSLRFKRDVADMADTTTLVGALRPVTFRFEPEEGRRGDDRLQYGLIAEEVAKVLPTLVSYDDEGKPYSVRYSLLTPLLLNELLRQEAELTRLRDQMADRDRQLAELRRSVEKLTKRKPSRAP